jgi:HEAT repeat protein
MMKEEEKSFDTVLAELFDAEPLPIAELYRLSDLQAERWEAFVVGWTAVPDERRRAIVRHLADITEDNFIVDFAPIFVHSFQDSEPEVRIAALDGLWDSTDLKLIPKITTLMQQDAVEAVRVAAAAALGHFVLLAEWGQLPERILPGLIETLLAEYDKEETAVSVRRVLLEGLGAAGHPRVNQLIEAAYESGDQSMQMSAIFAMGNSADRHWAVTVLAEMESPYEDMRAEAARAAGPIGSSDFVPMLAELAYDEDLGVRVAAITSLGQIGGDQVQHILTTMYDDPEVEEIDEVFEAVEEAIEESVMMAGDFNFVDLPFDEEEDEDDDLFDEFEG